MEIWRKQSLCSLTIYFANCVKIWGNLSLLARARVYLLLSEWWKVEESYKCLHIFLCREWWKPGEKFHFLYIFLFVEGMVKNWRKLLPSSLCLSAANVKIWRKLSLSIPLPWFIPDGDILNTAFRELWKCRRKWPPPLPSSATSSVREGNKIGINEKKIFICLLKETKKRILNNVDSLSFFLFF